MTGPAPALTRTGAASRLAAAARAVDAPGIVIAVSHRGHRTVHCGGSAPPQAVPRDQQRYEIGSASKTFTGLLLAELVGTGRLSYDDVAAHHLAPGRTPESAPGNPATLRHLITHTAGLPALPADFYPQAVRHWSTDPYGGYPAERVVAAYLRARPRHRPGTRWHYSNFGASVLGHTLTAATATPWEELIAHHVLAPLGLTGTRLHPEGAYGPGADATGHRPDGSTPVPGLAMGGFQPAGAVRATPGDLLTYLEAHLDPAGSPLETALRTIRRPVLRRGLGHRHLHTLTWFQHPSPQGPLYFHAGATTGQQAFLGFRPATHTAVVAVTTRRIRLRDTFIATAYGLLSEEPG
ncbi:serine hydrolase [Streptomyces sp. NBC_01306]|uniref:serine hydrolase domain-containing protein n=1 Tax=Streptomyces sp. NBC_01306 TaxID=2903819 RepID=UPI00225B06B5|nr:serine hydrolase domain-containing protein [Streptomyces sp. NBC_01306]MCX4726130.1 beta-lactamase family protein [Streptomyces sp. NBC_01306]